MKKFIVLDLSWATICPFLILTKSSTMIHYGYYVALTVVKLELYHSLQQKYCPDFLLLGISTYASIISISFHHTHFFCIISRRYYLFSR